MPPRLRSRSPASARKASPSARSKAGEEKILTSQIAGLFSGLDLLSKLSSSSPRTFGYALASTFACQIFGALWYGPLFRERFEEAMWDLRKQKLDDVINGVYGMNACLGVSFVAAFVTALGAVFLLQHLKIKSFSRAFFLGLVVWITMKATEVEAPIWQGHPLALILITESKSLFATLWHFCFLHAMGV